MLYLVFAAIIVVALVIGVIMAVLGSKEPGYDDVPTRKIGKLVAIGSVVAFIIVTIASSFHTTPARSTDIAQSFGKYVGTYQSGPRFTSPLITTESFSTQIQTLYLDGGDDNEDNVVHTNRVNVTYKGGGQGSIATTISWKISDREAKTLWERYRSFERVQRELVKAASESAIRDAANDYPAAEAQANDQNMATKAKSAISEEFKKYGVEVDNVRVTNVGLDEATQASIQKVVVAQQDLARAELERQKALTEAKTAKIREDSGILTPQANQRFCLDVTNAWDQSKNGQLPAGWNCTGASGVGVVATTK